MLDTIFLIGTVAFFCWRLPTYGGAKNYDAVGSRNGY